MELVKCLVHRKFKFCFQEFSGYFLSEVGWIYRFVACRYRGLMLLCMVCKGKGWSLGDLSLLPVSHVLCAHLSSPLCKAGWHHIEFMWRLNKMTDTKGMVSQKHIRPCWWYYCFWYFHSWLS
jgi:hypothetical protein